MDRFPSKAICSIIKSCGESGVKHFKYDGLEFSFCEPEAMPDILPTSSKYTSSSEETKEHLKQTDEMVAAARDANLLMEDASAWQDEQIDELYERDPNVQEVE